MTDLLSINGLVAGYGNIEVLHGISLAIVSHDYLAVIGANGAGKTTLLKSISGTVKAQAGSIRFDGRDLRGMPAHRIPTLGIAHVPEGRQVFPGLTVQDNIVAGSWLRRDRAERADSLEMVHTLFPRLKERRSQKAGTLSGGEQQMLAVARALMLRPRLLMLDEPSQGLAPKVVGEMYEQLATVHEAGTAILLIEQNTVAALKYAKQVCVMEHGRITMRGQAASMRGKEELRKAYLGI
jgi:branched-chain amino acid transport system ATP-binding protein